MTGEELYLMDTDVISEAGKLSANAAIQSFLAKIPSHRLLLSVMTIGKIHKGVAMRRRQNPDIGASLELWVRQTELAFRGQILNVDQNIARSSGEFLALVRSRPVVDTPLAATADWHGMTLISRNMSDFKDLPVKLINPWEERSTR